MQTFKSKHAVTIRGGKSVRTCSVPDAEYAEMLLDNPDIRSVRADILNTAGRISEARQTASDYERQQLTTAEREKVLLVAAALSNRDRLLAACTDDRCGYVGIQRRLILGGALSEGMRCRIEEVKNDLSPPTPADVEKCTNKAMAHLGHLTSDFSRCLFDHPDWDIGRSVC